MTPPPVAPLATTDIPPAPDEETANVPPEPEKEAAGAPPLPTTLDPPLPGSGEPVPPTPVPVPLLVPAVDTGLVEPEPALPPGAGVFPPQAVPSRTAASAVMGLVAREAFFDRIFCLTF